MKAKISCLAALVLASVLFSSVAGVADQRRGKNGGNSGGVKAPPEKQKSEPSEPPAGQSSGQSRVQPERADPEETGARQQTAPPETKSKSGPPPFDRPARTSGQGKSDPNRRAEPGPGRSRDNETAGPARSGGGTRERPTLQRDPDSRSGDDDSRRPPVLHRPSDPDTPPADRKEPLPPAASDKPPTGIETIELASTLVNIPVLVSDRSGRYVPRLGAKDFDVYEDGVKQEVAFFGNEQVPFNVVLLLDVSPSVAGNQEDIQDAAIEFVRQLRPDDKVMVASFDRRLHRLSGFTNDRSSLEYAIRRSETGNGTSVYDAVVETVTQDLSNVEGRKALILFSDGDDTTSRRSTYDDAISAVSEADVLVYGLRYPSSGSSGSGGGGTVTIPLPLPFPFPWPRQPRIPLPGPRQPRSTGSGDFMSDVTNAGGGPAYDADTIGDLGRLARQIAEELRHVYMVSYYPSNALSNGGHRSIRVRVKTGGDLAVRHRRGYNASEVKRQKT